MYPPKRLQVPHHRSPYRQWPESRVRQALRGRTTPRWPAPAPRPVFRLWRRRIRCGATCFRVGRAKVRYRSQRKQKEEQPRTIPRRPLPCRRLPRRYRHSGRAHACATRPTRSRTRVRTRRPCARSLQRARGFLVDQHLHDAAPQGGRSFENRGAPFQEPQKHLLVTKVRKASAAARQMVANLQLDFRRQFTIEVLVNALENLGARNVRRVVCVWVGAHTALDYRTPSPSQ